MHPKVATVYASLPATLIVYAEGQGVPREALLHAAGLTEDLLHNPDELVPYEALLGIWDLLLARFPGRPLGLEYAQIVPLSIFGALGYALAHCATARDALQCYLRFSRLLDPYLQVELREQGGLASIRIDHEPRVLARPEVMEMLVGGMHRHAQELLFGHGGVAPGPLCVSFTHPAAHEAEVYGQFFKGVRVRFEAAYNGTEFDADLLDRPIPAADPTLGRHLMAALELQLAGASDSPASSFADLVRAQLEPSLSQGTLSQEQVGRQLNVSTRTLQRRLREEGTSFLEVLEQLRRTRALRLLQETSLPVQEVAYLLGYSEPRAFHRSFRRWTGHSAGAWRSRAASGGAR